MTDDTKHTPSPPGDLSRIEELLSEILARLSQLEGNRREPQKEWWSPEELAAVLHRKPFTVREWCRLHRIQAEKDRYSRMWQIPDSEARRLIVGGQLLPTNCPPTR